MPDRHQLSLLLSTFFMHASPLVTPVVPALQGSWAPVVQILDRLTEDYAYSPQANCRKGGLLALAAAAVALAERKQVRQRPMRLACVID